MKQKVVIHVSLNDKKSCTKVIKTAVGVDGVTQAALKKDKNQLEVTGDGIDVVDLTNRLRKCVKYAEVESVSPAEEKKEEKKAEEYKLEWPYMGGVPVFYYQEPYYNRYPEPACSIM